MHFTKTEDFFLVFNPATMKYHIMGHNKTIPFALGRPFSPIYSQLMKLRAFLYGINVFKKYKLTVPVISVGNLTMGGTGKTPLVIYIARLLKDKGYYPAIISRGYRGKANAPVNIVSDGRTILLDPVSAGDEPWLIAKSLPDIVVATGKKRILPCQAAIDSFGCDIIILDDGFQHMSVARDVDLVLFDAGFFAGNSRVFPGGDLREPVSALNRCDAFIITGVNNSNKERAEKCTGLLKNKFDTKPVIQLSKIYLGATKHIPAHSGVISESVSLEQLPRDLFCFCGIAHPERFQQSLDEYGITTTGFKIFRDHYNYSDLDMQSLCRQAVEAGASGLLTTEKDMAKLYDKKCCNLPLFTLPLKISTNIILDNFILQKLHS